MAHLTLQTRSPRTVRSDSQNDWPQHVQPASKTSSLPSPRTPSRSSTGMHHPYRHDDITSSIVTGFPKIPGMIVPGVLATSPVGRTVTRSCQVLINSTCSRGGVSAVPVESTLTVGNGQGFRDATRNRPLAHSTTNSLFDFLLSPSGWGVIIPKGAGRD